MLLFLTNIVTVTGMLPLPLRKTSVTALSAKQKTGATAVLSDIHAAVAVMNGGRNTALALQVVCKGAHRFRRGCGVVVKVVVGGDVAVGTAFG